MDADEQSVPITIGDLSSGGQWDEYISVPCHDHLITRFAKGSLQATRHVEIDVFFVNQRVVSADIVPTVTGIDDNRWCGKRCMYGQQ